MRLAKLSPMFLAAVVGACSVQPEVLNSDLIRTRFGSYGVEVLEQSSQLRRSNLYSLESTGRVCRTYAIVQFIDVADADIAAVHDKVMSGQSLGASFRAAGWNLAKRTVHIGQVSVDANDHGILQLMQLEGPQQLAMHVYELYLNRGRRSLHYATVIEIHHPAYQNLADLEERYGSAATPEPAWPRLESFEALIQSD